MSPEEMYDANLEVMGLQVEGFEAGQGFPDSIKFNGHEYRRANEVSDGMVYSTEIPLDQPLRQEKMVSRKKGNETETVREVVEVNSRIELLVVDQEGKIVR